jgi:hypothetical protein
VNCPGFISSAAHGVCGVVHDDDHRAVGAISRPTEVRAAGRDLGPPGYGDGGGGGRAGARRGWLGCAQAGGQWSASPSPANEILIGSGGRSDHIPHKRGPEGVAAPCGSGAWLNCCPQSCADVLVMRRLINGPLLSGQSIVDNPERRPYSEHGRSLFERLRREPSAAPNLSEFDVGRSNGSAARRRPGRSTRPSGSC